MNTIDYKRIKFKGYKGYISNGMDEKRLLDIIDRICNSNGIREDLILKNKNGRRLSIIKIDNEEDVKGLSIKRYAYQGLQSAIKYFLEPTYAMRSWKNSLKTLSLGVPTPKIFAFLERKKFGIKQDGFTLTEYIDGAENLSDYFNKHFGCEKDFIRFSKEMKIGVIKKLSSFIRELHEKGLYHLDLVPQNILIKQSHDNGIDFFIIDLDSVRFYKNISKQKKIRNLVKLNSKFRNTRILTLGDRMRFIRNYLKDTSEEGDYKKWWNEVYKETNSALQRHGWEFY